MEDKSNFMAQKQALATQPVSRKQRLVATVISDKMIKTAVVEVTRTTKDKLYKKTVRHAKRYKADNTLNAHVGDRVLIEEAKPLSKDKRYRIIQIFEGHKAVEQIDADKSDLELLLEHTGEGKGTTKKEG